ncbi:hypothetical protein BST95_00740 [Halioglobus japonicus]|uniref:DUF4136 domain-containing protein n=1 Tax=Halioglobus japonicus TaxID=930805 RepID=A0AAP8MBN8_9GAMM|nr:DUF4136 domain-containing protein [Halioglobus japonicus]AQA16965.1 hypothetical protein BST95_00740 [Halioglobus japonicus]PLW84852.1 DUF4136 domain-containing protein [Halioglobus japonicus]GHD21757.1 hypothetical protein GCM10007052_32920 [Halioglobus japonicus]
MIKRSLRTLGALTVLALVSACSTTAFEPTMDFDDNFDFSDVKSIALQPVDRVGMGAIKISDMQVSRIDGALADELTRRGFKVVDDNADADLYLTWHLVTEERTDVRSYNSMSYYNCWRCGPSVSDVSVRQYTQGTFIVDMIDPERSRSVWRSVLESRLQSNPDPASAESAARRAEAAQAILAEFPPK